jgi:hypothetical protein
MEQNKPEFPETDSVETYTSEQKIILAVLKWGAWITSVIAMIYIMHY